MWAITFCHVFPFFNSLFPFPFCGIQSERQVPCQPHSVHTIFVLVVVSSHHSGHAYPFRSHYMFATMSLGYTEASIHMFSNLVFLFVIDINIKTQISSLPISSPYFLYMFTHFHSRHISLLPTFSSRCYKPIAHIPRPLNFIPYLFGISC